MAELCWRSLMTLRHLEWHLIPRWLLRSIFTQVPEQLLKGLAYWWSHAWRVCKNNSHSQMPSGLSYCLSYCSAVLCLWPYYKPNNIVYINCLSYITCMLRVADTLLKLLHGPCSRWCQFFGVCLGEGVLGGCFPTLQFVDLWRSGVIRCTLFMMLYLRHICQCGLHAVLWSHIGILMRLLAVESRSTAGG